MAIEMVSLKRSQAEITEDKSILASTEEDKFPFGTQLDLSTEEIEKLGISGAQVGQEYAIMAIGKVVRVSQSADEDEARENIDIQITDMGLERKATSVSDQAAALFPGRDNG